jgi:hypothetical protein
MAGRWVVAAVVLVVALGGCGDDAEDEPAIVPVPVTSGASPVPSGSPVVAAATRTGGTAAAAAPTAAAPAGTGPDRPASADGAATAAGLAGFVAVVQREMPELVMDRRDEEIATLAQQACGSLVAGRSAGAVVDEVRTYGADRAAARELVKLAITTACPAQHRRAIEF